MAPLSEQQSKPQLATTAKIHLTRVCACYVCLTCFMMSSVMPSTLMSIWKALMPEALPAT